MEIQQRDSETLAAYGHWYKLETKRCSFKNNTVDLCIFIKGLQDAQNTAVKIYKKYPKTLLDVIKLVKKFNVAQQVTATLTSSTVNVMYSDDWCFVCGKRGHIGWHCPDAQWLNTTRIVSHPKHIMKTSYTYI